jgi:3',5'-cyclic AMP phosphodiesterase CpdA
VETLPRVQPQNFIREPIVGQSSFLLHLSDLHFGSEHGFVTTSDYPGKRTLARLIIDDLRNEVKLGSPAGVVISGDLTWRPEEEQFEMALDFIERLKSEFGLESYHFIVIPGNHDIKWVDDPAEKPIGDKAQKVKFPAEEAKRNFRNFYTKLFGIPPNNFFSQGRRFLLNNYITVDVIGLSSSELEQTHFAGYGYVGAEQLQAAIREMGWEEGKPRTTYRLVTLHHHLMPVVPEEEIKGYDKNYSITLDAGYIIYGCLTREVDMVVHGHQHQPFTGAIMRSQGGKKFKAGRTLIVNAAGSAGVEKKHIPSGNNFYTIYNFLPSRIEIRLRMKSDADVGFKEAEGWGSELERNQFGGMILKSES